MRPKNINGVSLSNNKTTLLTNIRLKEFISEIRPLINEVVHLKPCYRYKAYNEINN